MLTCTKSDVGDRESTEIVYPCKRFGRKEAQAKWYNHQIWKYLRFKTYGRLHYISVAILVLRKIMHKSNIIL